MIVGFDDQHAAFNETFPMFARYLNFEGVNKFQGVDSIIELEISEVDLNKQLECFLDEYLTIFGLEFDTVL